MTSVIVSSREDLDKCTTKKVSPTGWPRSIQGICLAVVATPPSIAAFLFIRLLARFAPEAAPVHFPQSKPTQVPQRERAGNSLIRVFVYLYQHSFVHWYLHRNGYQCTFIPSCTDYATRAVSKYGLWRGLILAGNRFRRCSPAYPGDFLDFP
jgi:putative component of membrane protein insertase Oxa1/YidC/SpoIIIJ protein YidD